MAELEGLYLGMGIDTSQLNSDFVDAEKTISENINRINREMKLVQIRGQMEIDGLDESAESIDKLKIQEEALMAQMGLQQDKIILLSAAYEKLNETRGANAESTQQIEMQLAREQLALQKLETQMEGLSEQEKIALGINLEMLALIEPAISAIDSAIAAGTAMPIPHAKAAATALIGVASVAEGTREATEELREENPAKVLDGDFRQAAETIDDSWQQIADSTNNTLAEMETSINEADKSFSDMKILPELDSESFIQAIELLESNSLGETLRKTNALIDESDSLIGKLSANLLGLGTIFSQIDEPIIEFAQTAIENFKELKQVANELNLPIAKASDLASRINLSGADYNDVRDFVRGVQDAVIKGDSEDPEVLALERYGVVIQDAQGKLLAFDETLDRLYQGYLKAREAGEAEAYVIMTNGQAAQDVLPYFENLAQAEEDMAKIKWSTIDTATLEEAVRDTRLLETQIGEFQNALSSLAAPAADIALKNTFELFKAGTELIEENREAVIYWSFVLMEGINTVTAFAKEVGDTATSKIVGFTDALREFEKEFGITDTLKNFLPEEWFKAPDANSIFSRAQKRLEDFTEANEKARKEAKATADKISGLSYSLNRIKKYESELADLRIDIQFGKGESYQKSLEESKLWREKALADAKQYADEQAIIEELSSAKRELIEKERADKIIEIQKSVNAELRFSFDERQKLIESEKEKFVAAGMDESDAYQRAQDTINEEFKTSLDERLAKIEEEKDAWISAGMDEAEAFELAQRRIDKAKKEAAEEARKYWNDAADIEYSMTHTAFEKQLRDIARWKDAEREKAETAEEVAGIIRNAAAKEAQAFEDAVDRIKGKVQTLEDKIFEIDHSQYENDLRRIQQEYLRTAEDLKREGLLTPEREADLKYFYSRQKQQLDARAAESRKTGGDYTKTPEGAMQRGGNNIVVIGADQILDDGLKRANIGVMVDENRIRAQLSQGLSQEARDLANAAQATRDLTDAQKQFTQQANGFQLIEGDRDTTSNFQQIEGDQLFSAPTAELQQFGETLQQTTAGIEQADPAQKIAQAESALTETLNQAAKNFPADYFKNLADGTKGVSEMQLRLTNSTLDLIDAQGKLKDALRNMPQMPQANEQNEGFQRLSYSRQAEPQDLLARKTYAADQLPTDSFKRLSASSSDLAKQQDLLARKARDLEHLPLPTQDSGIEFGFDHDLFGTLATVSTSLISLLQAAGAIAPHPAIKIGALAFGGALGAATAKGTFDATNEQPDDHLKPYIETDLSGFITPLTAIDQNVEAILQRFQSQTDKDTTDLGSVLSEYFAPLSNIERYAQDISQAVQSVEFPTEIIVTPLNNIAGTIQQILTALQNRQPATITVSPNIDIDLGGAYVFDDTLKKALVDDITTDVVVSIKDTVQQATSRASYGFGA